MFMCVCLCIEYITCSYVQKFYYGFTFSITYMKFGTRSVLPRTLNRKLRQGEN